MDLVAIDLEGSGAQDRGHEAILEIALIPIVDWQPDVATAYCTLINPERPIPQRPWISPGLTDAALRDAPTLATVEPELAQRINGKYLVGHNVGVDWRLLHRRSPGITPAGLIDTLRLARLHHNGGLGHKLGALVELLGLTEKVNQFAAGSKPHRALWDTAAVALVLPVLARRLLGENPSIDELISAVGINLIPTKTSGASQLTLFD